MADTSKKPVGGEETETEGTTRKPKKAPVKEGKIRGFIKRHKRELIAGGIGTVLGAGTTVGVFEYGKRRANRKADTYNPPQVDEIDGQF